VVIRQGAGSSAAGDCRLSLEHYSATEDWWSNRTGAMPRFFFNYRDGDKSAEDLEGTDLADEPASVIEAMISAKRIIAEARGGSAMGC
jgi:hypothetical protein